MHFQAHSLTSGLTPVIYWILLHNHMEGQSPADPPLWTLNQLVCGGKLVQVDHTTDVILVPSTPRSRGPAPSAGDTDRADGFTDFTPWATYNPL